MLVVCCCWLCVCVCVRVCDTAECDVLARCVTISIACHEATISLKFCFSAFCVRVSEHFSFAEGIFGMHQIGNFNEKMHTWRERDDDIGYLWSWRG